MREIDVTHGFVGTIKEGGAAPPCVVDDLVRHDQCAGFQILADAADRSHRQDCAGTRFAQRPDVGAVIYEMRRNGMAETVTREKHHRFFAQLTEYDGSGRYAIRRTHDFAAYNVECGKS